MATQPQRTVPDRMQALVLRGPGDWSIETVETPTLDDVENVLCAVRAVSICGTDPKIFDGHIEGWPPGYPFIPGHEWAGEVVAIGEDVNRVDVGDRIFNETHHGCGYCEACRTGAYNLCEHYGEFETGHRQIGHTMDGAYAEYVSVPADTLHPLPEDVSMAEGALLDVNATAVHCAVRGGVEPGDTVAVFGTGTVGLLLVQNAKVLGASEVIAVGNPQRNEVAAELGADHTISYRDDDIVDQILALTDGVGVDVSLEAAGVQPVFEQAVAATRKGGTISADGIPNDDLIDFPVGDLVLNQIELRGARAHANRAADSARLVATGAIDVGRLLTHEFPFEDFESAYETFTQREDGAIKVVLRF